MNGGCHAVGPRPVAPRRERFGVILYSDPTLGISEYLATYSQQWGEFKSELSGDWYPVQYASDCYLGESANAWTKDLHERTMYTRGEWDTHLEQFLPPDVRERIFEPMKKIVTSAMEKHWNPTEPIEWELANIG